MRSSRGAWSLAGVVAGAAGLATSYVAAMLLTIRESPVVAVAELVIRITPGWLAEYLIGLVGKLDKPLLILGIFGLLALACAWAGRLARRSWWGAVLVFAALAGVGATGVAVQRGATTGDGLPVVVGFVTWLAVLALLTAPLRREDREVEAEDAATPHLVPRTDEGLSGHARRTFLLRAGLVAAAGVVLGVAGRVVGRGRRHVEESRRLLRLPQVTEPVVPRGARTDLEGITPWVSANDRFYLIHTAMIVPTIEPADWTLRIHGAVDRELVLTYDDLLRREFTERWTTLTCVSNPVGGDLIGNAWWSGVRLADLLEEAGVHADADAVLQTSHDGWTCGTPLEALTDDRGAMLALAMNGVPLPIEHGFPVRTVVPGLYGYVSATKWVEDLEVTRFADISAYWTERGWSERGPVKLSSRVDVPRSGEEVDAGEVRFGGVAWAQGTGVEAVEFSVDGGPWVEAELATVPNVDTWVQWTGSAEVASGDHTVRVRATDADGTVQDGTQRDVVPDGATGWHTSDFTAS
jgi:DMSO/TMAO reductase YedYZ molybdopterin-dependent catalytic subunit